MTRRGRRAKTGKREANGRLSRNAADVSARLKDAHDKEERDMLAVGLEARVRVHGITDKFLDKVPVEQGKPRPTAVQVARDQMAGSVVGRLCLTGSISRAQYDAAMTWLEDRAAYLRAVAPAQGTEPSALDPNASSGRSHYENEGATQRAVRAYKAAMNAVQAKQNELRLTAHLFGALDVILVREIMLHHMVPDLRLSLNALAKHYKFVGDLEKAA